MRGGGLLTFFATFVPELKNEKNLNFSMSSGERVDLTFASELKNDKIQNSLPSVGGWVGRGVGGGVTFGNAQGLVSN